MRALKNTFLFIILVSLNLNRLNGQAYSKGFIFSNKGDTANGFVMIPENNLPAINCVFKPSMNENPAILGPADISGFGASKVLYVATRFNWHGKDTAMFTRLIYEGANDLNYFEIYGVKYFIITRPDSSVYAINYPSELTPEDLFSGLNVEKKFRLQADSIFPDAPDLPEYQAGVQPDINSLLNLFKQYHSNAKAKPSGSVARSSGIAENFSRGYIISSENDTIEGLIGNQLNYTFFKSCIFSTGKNENAIKFYPKDIAGFGSRKENKTFVSATFRYGDMDTSAFVRLLLDGSIGLMYFQTEGTDHFLLRDQQNKISELVYPPQLYKEDYLAGLNSSKKFRIQADSLYSGLGLGNAPKPEIKSMISALEKYHMSNNLRYKVYYRLKWELNFGPVAGVSFIKYNPTGKFTELKTYSDPAPYLGAYLSLTSTKYGAGVFVRNTFSYHEDNYSYRLNSPLFVLYHLTTIKSLVDNLQTGLKIVADKIPFSPYAEGGPVLSYYINPHYENFDSEVFTESTKILSLYNRKEINSSLFFGYFVRAGFKINCGKGRILWIAGEYDKLKGSKKETMNFTDISATYIINFK